MKRKRTNYNISPNNITELSQCEIFVFGSNLVGHHGSGAARTAYEKFGAQWGVGNGPTGRCYAIPTMHGGIEDIRPYVEEFIDYAREHPMNRFLLTRVGCGIAGFVDKEMAELFQDAFGLPNIAIPLKWLPWMIRLNGSCFDRPDAAPDVINEKVLHELSKRYLYEIGSGCRNRIPNIHVRYTCETGKFRYTGLENCFFFEDEDMYVWENDDKWEEDHNQDMVEYVFQDECKGRGFATRVLFAGVSTNIKDSKGQYIYTGDVISIRRRDGSFYDNLAISTIPESKEYGFMLDNHSLCLSECKERGYILTRTGTTFYKMDMSEYPLQSVQSRAHEFNMLHSRQDVLMSRLTPNFSKEDWEYSVMDKLGIEFNWDK